MRHVVPPWGASLTDAEHSLVRFAVIVTALGFIAMLTRLVGARREVGDRYRPAVHAGVAVTTVAFLSYALLIFEFLVGYHRIGGLWVPTTESVGTWSARYMDWAVSVPLLVVEVVAVSAVIGAAAARARLLGAGAAGAMVVLGYLGGVVVGGGTDFAALLWFGIASSLCFVVVYIVVITVVLRSIPVLPAAARAPMRRAMYVLLVTWFVYPVVFGIQGIASGGGWTTAEHLLLCTADLVAKVVFGLQLLRVARIRTAADVIAEDDVHPESIWVDQQRLSEGVQATAARTSARR